MRAVGGELVVAVDGVLIECCSLRGAGDVDIAWIVRVQARQTPEPWVFWVAAWSSPAGLALLEFLGEGPVVVRGGEARWDDLPTSVPLVQLSEILGSQLLNVEHSHD